jgi:hypothetical protein
MHESRSDLQFFHVCLELPGLKYCIIDLREKIFCLANLKARGSIWLTYGLVWLCLEMSIQYCTIPENRNDLRFFCLQVIMYLGCQGKISLTPVKNYLFGAFSRLPLKS